MKLKELASMERFFFETDETEKIAKVVLHYDSPEDLFDRTCLTKIPLLSQETLGYFLSVFGMVPSKYKVDLTLRFDDLGSYTEEQLKDIMEKNLVLELMSKESATRKRDRQAYWFMAGGILSFFIMFMIHVFWTSESIWSELLFYLLDILTTVFLYEAVTILSLERKEKLAVVKNLRDSFSAIHFESSQ